MTLELVYQGVTAIGKPVNVNDPEIKGELKRLAAGRTIYSTGSFDLGGDQVIVYAVVEASTLTIPGAAQ